MKVEGTHRIPAPRERVWQLLNDPAVLARCTPGVTRLEAADNDTYHATLTLGIGPVRGTFEGQLRITDKTFPEQMTLEVEGSGAPGGVRAVGTLVLSHDGDATVIDYQGEPLISGRLAAVGARLLTGVARKFAGEFFANLAREAAAPEMSAPDDVR